MVLFMVVLGLMGEIILAAELMELGEADFKELERHPGGLLALTEMPVELLAADQTDDGGLGGDDGGGRRVAVEAIGVVCDDVARRCGLDHLAGAMAVAHHVVEAAHLDVAQEAGGGSFGLGGLACREAGRTAVAQTVVAQVVQGLGIMCLVIHNSRVFCCEVIQKGTKKPPARPKNCPPRVQL